MENSVISDLKEKVENSIESTYTNLDNFKNKALDICNKIDKDDKVEVNKNKIQRAEKGKEVYKEKEKLSVDLMYVEGQIECTKLQIKNYEEEILEMEQAIENVSRLTKELEHKKGETVQAIVDKHNAIKQAIKYYKQNLDIYLHVEEQENMLRTTVCYFTQKFDDTFSYVITKKDNENKWTLNSIKPNLSQPVFLALQEKFNNCNNLAALSCTVRKILMSLKDLKK